MRWLRLYIAAAKRFPPAKMSVSLILILLGVLLVIEGIPYFAFPKKVKEWALVLQEIPDKQLRIIGIAAMVFGLMVLFLVRIVS